MARDFTPYSTIDKMVTKPAWIVDSQEQLRVGSYEAYEQIYWNHPDTFKLQGEHDDPLYIPSGRVVVETLHRYLANEMVVIPDEAFGDDNQRAMAKGFFDALARRERFYSRFNTNKRLGIIRGDWVFHIKGDPERAELSRISIETIHPGRLFPIKQDDRIFGDPQIGDPNVIIGWHIIDTVDEGGNAAVLRTTYLKETGIGGPSPISLEIGVYEINAWGGPGEEKDPKKLRSVFGPETFPAPIDQLPIYHIPNFQDDVSMWGSSEMRGIERVMQSVNQSITDEELELVLNGLGLYATNQSKPIDSLGNELEWNLGPGRVIGVTGEKGFFERVSGTTSVAPQQDHLKYLHGQMAETLGTPEVAKGKVDVSVAESGIALTMQMGPLLARVTEKEQIITDVITNYLFDLTKWVIAYEGTAWNFLLEDIRYVPIYGEKLPENQAQRFNEIMQLATAQPLPLIPMNVAWDELRKIGWDLPDNEVMLEALLQQRQAMAAADMEGVASRIDTELAEEEEEEVPPEETQEEGEAQ